MWLDTLHIMKKRSGKTTDQISQESGVPKGTLNKLFAGQTKDPQYSTLRAVVYCLGYTVDDLEKQDTSAFDAQKKEPPSISTETENDSNLQKLLSNYDAMNLSGQYALADYSDFLSSKAEYRKHSNVPVKKQA